MVFRAAARLRLHKNPIVAIACAVVFLVIGQGLTLEKLIRWLYSGSKYAVFSLIAAV